MAVTFADMRTLALIESERIGVMQDFLVREGFRKERDTGQLRNQQVFDAIVRLIDLIESDDVILDQLHLRVAAARPAPAGAGA